MNSGLLGGVTSETNLTATGTLAVLLAAVLIFPYSFVR
jgi:hypothetical protein